MKKTIYTLNVDNYAPEITAITYPLLELFAMKIGADFFVIEERKSPQFPPVYEKLQIREIADERRDDWIYYIDSDALVHPDLFDVTEHLPMDTVLHNANDIAGNRWRYDEYFRRDGRHIGSCNWFTVASRWCLDLWSPLHDITPEHAIEHNIWPTQNERATVIEPSHLIDDYILSRNIARFGLKFTTLRRILADLGDGGNYLWHEYTISVDQKVDEMRKVLDAWGLSIPDSF
jgi:hypothetical protein